MNAAEICFELLIAGWFFYLGASIGSFGNVVAVRLPRNMPIGLSVSRCPACQNVIRFTDNIPVLGWLLLRGRCRQCHAPISSRYLFVEIAFGLMFLSIYFFDVRTLGQGLEVMLGNAAAWPRLDEILTLEVMGRFVIHTTLLSILGIATLMELEPSVIPIRFWGMSIFVLMAERVSSLESVVSWDAFETMLVPIAAHHAAGRVDLIELGVDGSLACGIFLGALASSRRFVRTPDTITRVMPTSMVATVPVILALGFPSGAIVVMLSIVARGISSIASSFLTRGTWSPKMVFFPSFCFALLSGVIIVADKQIFSSVPLRQSGILFFLLGGLLLSLVGQWIWDSLSDRMAALNSMSNESRSD